MIILVEINIEGLLWKNINKASIYVLNDTAEMCPLVKDIGHFQPKKISHV